MRPIVPQRGRHHQTRSGEYRSRSSGPPGGSGYAANCDVSAWRNPHIASVAYAGVKRFAELASPAPAASNCCRSRGRTSTRSGGNRHCLVQLLRPWCVSVGPDFLSQNTRGMSNNPLVCIENCAAVHTCCAKQHQPAKRKGPLRALSGLADLLLIERYAVLFRTPRCPRIPEHARYVVGCRVETVERTAEARRWIFVQHVVDAERQRQLFVQG